MELPNLITIKGDAIIKPAVRKNLKDEVLGALVRDLRDACELVDVVSGTDGIIVVVQHEEEGCFSFELNMKVKALDYDAWELGESIAEEDEE